MVLQFILLANLSSKGISTKRIEPFPILELTNLAIS